MSDAPAGRLSPDYGLDAPGVVRNLFLTGGLAFVSWAVVALGLWSGDLVVGPIAGVEIRFQLASMGLWSGLALTGVGLWMIWSSRVGKIRRREWILDHVAWTGRERVLDVGCGRGLMLLGAAKRLSSGKAIGIDIWQAEDLSGNRPGAVLTNAQREEVSARVAVGTADMRRQPFAGGTFDVVLSCVAIHNVPSAEGRAEAITEIARVLKPGGCALIEDIRHQGEYAVAFAANGCEEIRRLDSRVGGWIQTLITIGSLRPATLLVRKAA